MKKFVALALLIATALAPASHAEENRLTRLSESYLMTNLERDGDWAVEVTDAAIRYFCLRCAGSTSATLELIVPYAPENFGTLERRYLAGREQFCADLTMNSKGRCVDTSPTSLRGGALNGYISKSDIDGREELEIVFFYRERQFPPALLRTTVSVAKGSSLPQGAIQMFQWHMAKLTVFW